MDTSKGVPAPNNGIEVRFDGHSGEFKAEKPSVARDGKGWFIPGLVSFAGYPLVRLDQGDLPRIVEDRITGPFYADLRQPRSQDVLMLTGTQPTGTFDDEFSSVILGPKIITITLQGPISEVCSTPERRLLSMGVDSSMLLIAPTGKRVVVNRDENGAPEIIEAEAYFAQIASAASSAERGGTHSAVGKSTGEPVSASRR